MIDSTILARLTTSEVTATVHPKHEHLILLTHNVHPVQLSLSECQVDPKRGTSSPSMAQNTITEIGTCEGIPHHEFSWAWDKAERANRATQEPNDCNWAKVNGKRLERVYTDWFKYFNCLYVAYCSECIRVKKSIESINARIEEIKADAPETIVCKKANHKSDDCTTIENDRAQLKFRDSSGSVNLELKGYHLTDSDKIEIFKFLGTLQNK